jgi:CheY-like chemotaxis protein
MPVATPPSVLVVDDNHDNADIVRQYLEAEGYPVSVAYSGEEALSLFGSFAVHRAARRDDARTGRLGKCAS